MRELEAAGASVHLAHVDVSDDVAVTAWLEDFARNSWPAIHGVMHCAAVIEPALVSTADAAVFATAFRAKAVGAFVLDRALASAALDFFVTFSSVASLLPQAGQASYAAASAFLDAFAFWQRGRGRKGLAVGWGVWQGLGRAAARLGGGIQRLEASGISTFEPRQGLDALRMLIEVGATHALVAPVDWARYRSARGAALTPLVEEVAANSNESPDAPRASFRDVLLEVAPADRSPLLEAHLQELAARVLRLPVGRIDPVTPLGSLGLESLMALELRNRLEASLGIKVSATVVWNHPTVRALAAHLGARLGLPAEAPAPPDQMRLPDSSEHRGLASDVTALTEEQALRKLLGEH